jgi:membrane-associated phospholipid phosphatase
MRIWIFLTAFLIVPYVLFGQAVSDTSKYKKHHFVKQYALPVGLLAGSLILQTGNIKQDIQDFFPDTDNRVADWLKNGPEVEMYAFDLAGIKHRNTVFDQTKYLLISHLVTAGIVQALKVTTHVTRPSGGKHSFPSGHTSYAFVGATVLYHEFRETQPLLAYSGFAMATATGILRITNDAHWLPDVMAGAAIGILVTNLVYQIEPFKKFQPFSQKCEINVIREKNMNLFCLQFSF